jgi:hypothetical protein
MAKTKTKTPAPAKRTATTGSDNVIVKKPASDIFTALAAAAVVAMLLTLICVWMRANALFGEFIKF